MRYKLIALDLDDTLLNSSHQIPEKNLKAIQRAKENGVHVLLASGRIYDSLIPFRRRLGLEDSYTISTGGALITDPEGRVADSTHMDPEVTWALMNWAAQRNVYFQVYTDNEFLYMHRTLRTDDYERVGGLAGREELDLLSRHDLYAGKVLFLDSREKLASMRVSVAQAFPGITVETSHPTLLELSRTDASKGKALQRLGKILGISREEMIAVGDSEIDLSMIEYAGLGVAVANAVPAVLRAADYVAPSCDENAVAEVIDRFLLSDRTPKAPASGT